MQTEVLWFAPTAALLFGFLLGSIPFGLLLTRVAGAGDIRMIGSGNIGATNVLRTGRKGLAAATLLLDAAKGAAAILIVEAFTPGNGPLAAAGAFVGHCYPVWLRFRGGKGIATLLGIVLALFWPLGLVFAVVWLAVFAPTRMSSAASLATAVAMPVAGALLGRMDLVPLLAALGLIAIWKHRANLSRIAAGTEPRFGTKPVG